MQDEKPPVQLLTSCCPVCCSRLICGETVKRGLHQCTKCKRYWVIEISEGDVHVKEASRDYRRMLAL